VRGERKVSVRKKKERERRRRRTGEDIEARA
jgi:hypothetical protein